MDLSMVKKYIVMYDGSKRQKKGALRMHCGDHRYFMASCLRQFEVASGLVEMVQYKKDSGKPNE
jgi:hypothetical protein